MSLVTDTEVDLNDTPVSDAQPTYDADQTTRMTKLCTLYQAHIAEAERYKVIKHNVGYDDHWYWAEKLKTCIEDELHRMEKQQKRTETVRAVIEWFKNSLFFWMFWTIWWDAPKTQVIETAQTNLLKLEPEVPNLLPGPLNC